MPADKQWSVEMDAQNCYNAVAGFMLAIKQAQTEGEARRIHKIIEAVIASLEAVSESAVEREGELL